MVLAMVRFDAPDKVIDSSDISNASCSKSHSACSRNVKTACVRRWRLARKYGTIGYWRAIGLENTVRRLKRMAHVNFDPLVWIRNTSAGVDCASDLGLTAVDEYLGVKS